MPTKTSTPEIRHIEALFPPKLLCLFQPKRYKVLVGGRGSSKSWSAARALLLLGQIYRLRILCCREIQQSIEQSVHKLLCDQIYELGLQDFYRIEKKSITGENGTQFSFAGLKSNVQQIKSFESLNIVWVEEAANVSELSWDTLIPTMRAEGFIPGTDSELWITFNPDLEDDNTYQRFVVDPPHDAMVVKINYQDNPFFPPALRRHMEMMKVKDYDKYLHVYGGECRKYQEGTVYKHEILEAEAETRFTHVARTPTAPIEAAWDWGYNDATAIWIGQRTSTGIFLLDYIEGQQKTVDHYLKELSLLDYAIDIHHLPHDMGKHYTGLSLKEVIRAKGHRVRDVPVLSVEDGINAVRSLFPSMFFNKLKCAAGIAALRRYHYELVEDGKGGLKNSPKHDRYSHAADALRYFCIAMREPKAAPKIVYPHVQPRPGGWMK